MLQLNAGQVVDFALKWVSFEKVHKNFMEKLQIMLAFLDTVGYYIGVSTHKT